MTISVCVIVNDGLVLGSDSATTLRLNSGDAQVYNNADKIFNLYKGLPIGAATWGLGQIGRASMATVAKDFRRLLSNASNVDPRKVNEPWGLPLESYTVKGVAEKFKTYLSERLKPVQDEVDAINTAKRQEYEAARQQGREADEPELVELSQFYFRVVGYDANSEQPSVWDLCFDGSDIKEPIAQSSQVSWGGQVEPVQRIVLGLSDNLVPAIQESLQKNADDAVSLVRGFVKHTEAPLVNPAMPIIDAIDLVEFLVDTAIKFYRFIPGAPIVGGPIEVATITKHEGFRWIKRKHFFSATLNPAL